MTTRMVTVSDASVSNRPNARPTRRQQRGEVVAVGHGRQSGQDVADVVQRIDAAALTADDNRVNNFGAVTGVRVPDKKVKFSSR